MSHTGMTTRVQFDALKSMRRHLACPCITDLNKCGYRAGSIKIGKTTSITKKFHAPECV